MTVASTSPWAFSTSMEWLINIIGFKVLDKQWGRGGLPNWHVLRYRAASLQGIKPYLAENTARARSLGQAPRHEIHPRFPVLYRRTQVAMREPRRGPTGATSRPRAP